MLEGQTAGRVRKPIPYVLANAGFVGDASDKTPSISEQRAAAILDYLAGRYNGAWLTAECQHLERAIYGSL